MLIERAGVWHLVDATADELTVLHECASMGRPLTRSAMVLGLRRLEKAKASRGVRRVRRKAADDRP